MHRRSCALMARSTASARLFCAALAAGSLLVLSASPASAYFDCPPIGDWCVAPDNGAGTASLPTQCPMGSIIGAMIGFGNNPNNICCVARLQDVGGANETPGGPLGGHVQTYSCTLLLEMEGMGRGATYNFHRTISIPVQCVSFSAPRRGGAAPPQSFPTEMFMMQGQLPAGDPDFDLLRISAGNQFGMPSPGHTTLTRLPGNNWAVDSFFDVFYTVEFTGKPGGPLGGMSGSTTGTIRLNSSQHEPPQSYPAALCIESPLTPPPGPQEPPMPAPCPISDVETMVIIDGLPPASSIQCAPTMQCFINNIAPGGTLGGTHHTGPMQLALEMTGTGALSGYSRPVVQVPMQIECELAPLNLASVRQTVPLDMFRMHGQITGDPDFDLLRITAGTGFGMPSPGHTTLTRLPSGQWAVDSFFDITYRIDFVGAPGGPLGGMSGSTTATIRMRQGEPHPELDVLYCGLEHTPLGPTMTLFNEPQPGLPSGRRLSGCCLGSSGQDGVEVQLAMKGGGGGGGGGSGGSADGGAQGHRCEIDWAVDALPPSTMVSLPQGAGLQFSSFFDIFYGEIDEGARSCRLIMTGQNNNEMGLRVASTGFDLPAVQLSLRLHGDVVTTHTLTPPYAPGPMVFGTFAASQAEGLVVQHRLIRVAAGGGLPDTMEISVTNPFDAVCGFPGQSTVTADQAVLRVSLNGLPPGTRYIGNYMMQIHGVSPMGLPPMPLHLHSAHVIPKGGHTTTVRESPSKASMSRVAVGDVNGDGAMDLMCTSIDDHEVADNSMLLLEADLDGDGEFEPVSSMSSTAGFGADGTDPMPPNGSLRFRPAFFDVFTEDVWVRASDCSSGACTSTEVSADFSGLGATTMRVRAYDGDTLMADVSGIPCPPGGAMCAILEDAMTGPVTIKGTCLSSGHLRVEWSWGASTTATICPCGSGLAGTGASVACTRLVMEAEDWRVPIEMVAMELRGSNICAMAVTDLDVDPVPECAADIAPPGGNGLVNINDLLAIIINWGPCPQQPCPPYCSSDTNKDCMVNILDLLQVIINWGPCPTVTAGAPTPPTPPDDGRLAQPARGR